MRIPGMRGLGVWTVLKAAVKEFIDDGMSTYAAALSYRVLFSLFPFLVFLVALLGFFHMPELFAWLREQAALVVPAEAMQPVNDVLDELQTPQGGLASVGIALAIYSASVGILAVMDALNVAYDVTEARPTWKRTLLSIVYTVALAILLALAAALMVVGPGIAAWIAEQIGLEQVFVTVWTWARWALIVALLMLSVAVVYYVAPDVEQRFRYITPGAVVAVIVWIVASLAFAWYVQSFADYNATYGSLGAIIILLFYFYISAAVLLFGAEINAEIEHRMPEGKDPGQKELPAGS